MHAQSLNGNFIISSNSPFFQTANFLAQSQCFQISSTTSDMAAATFHINDPSHHPHHQPKQLGNSTKFKNHIMEKYLRGLDEASSNSDNNNSELMVNHNIEMKDMEVDVNKKPELSKWLASTANFTPSDYNVDFRRNERKSSKSAKQSSTSPVSNGTSSLCEKELLAAETLVMLKTNFRTKFYNS